MPRPNSDDLVKNLLAWLVLLLLVGVAGFFAYSVWNHPPKISTENRKDGGSQQTKQSSNQRSEQPIGKIKVLASGLNLRSSPEKSRNVIGSLRRNTVLSVISKHNKWFEVKTPEGKKGFVTASFRYIQVMEMREP